MSKKGGFSFPFLPSLHLLPLFFLRGTREREPPFSSFFPWVIKKEEGRRERKENSPLKGQGGSSAWFPARKYLWTPQFFLPFKKV